MLERMSRFVVKHRKSGKPFSDLQRLNLFYQCERRQILGVKANLQVFMSRNPTLKQFVWDAIVSISAAEDALKREYERDHDALVKHTPVEV